MKEYKGWELIKGLEDGTIKDGEMFKWGETNIIVHTIEKSNFFALSDGQILDNSIFCNNNTFTKVVKHYNFFEAIEMISKGKKMSNDFNVESNVKGYWCKRESDGALVWKNNKSICIESYEINSDWFEVEEED